MKAWVGRWATRIDGMALRERAMVFCSAVTMLLFLYFWVLGNPTTDRLRSVSREISKKQAETRVIQENVRKLVGGGEQNGNASYEARIADLKRRIATADARLAQEQQGLLPPNRIPALLEEILKRDRKLELIELRSLPATAMTPEGTAPVAAQADGANGIRVYRHGVEITVRGGYFDLLRYLSALESQPIRMFWKDVEIATTDYPRISMKLTVYTLSLERSWVVV
jgi:MSHA biogenesis protein MshJ